MSLQVVIASNHYFRLKFRQAVRLCPGAAAHHSSDVPREATNLGCPETERVRAGMQTLAHFERGWVLSHPLGDGKKADSAFRLAPACGLLELI